jgi:hypothetical protein
MKVRIEIGYAVDAIKRGLGALGKLLQLLGRQVAVLGLDLSEVVKNQRRSSGEPLLSHELRALSRGYIIAVMVIMASGTLGLKHART